MPRGVNATFQTRLLGSGLRHDGLGFVFTPWLGISLSKRVTVDVSMHQASQDAVIVRTLVFCLQKTVAPILHDVA